MQFANPIWLAALGGILIPLAIHLLSRKEGKIIRIGSIRHFEETSTRQFKSIKLNEVLLLMLRSLLIILIVFLLAELQWPGSPNGKRSWLLIEKGLDHDADLTKTIDELTQKGFEKRAFAKGFPIAEDSISDSPDNYWTLIDALSVERLDSVVIISANRNNKFKGERRAIPANISWISKSLPDKEEVISKISVGTDSVWVRTGKFEASGTTFTTKVTSDAANASQPDSVHTTIIADKPYAYDAKLLHASLKAIDRYTPHFISVTLTDRSNFKEADWMFWLSDEAAPSTKGNTIVLSSKPSQHILEQQSPNDWILTKRLTPENVVEENLTVQLAQILFPEKEAWKKADALDVRSTEQKLLEQGPASLTKAGTSIYSGHALWIILLLLTFIAERIVAYKRNQ